VIFFEIIVTVKKCVCGLRFLHHMLRILDFCDFNCVQGNMTDPDISKEHSAFVFKGW
jgi:hypothetical protein